MILLLSPFALIATMCAAFLVSEELKEGPDEKAPATLATLEADPLLNFEHPGLVQTHETQNVANYLCGFCDYFPTGITRNYDVTTDPGAVLEDFSLAAERAGWEPVAQFCNRDTRSVDLHLEKSFDEFNAAAHFRIRPSSQAGDAPSAEERTASVYFDVDAWYGSPRTPFAESDSTDC